MTSIEHVQMIGRGPAGSAPEREGWRRRVEQALTHAVAGRTADALAELDPLERHHRGAAVDALAERAADVLERLQHRSQHPIRLGYVLDRIPLDADVDPDSCVDFLADALFRSAGVRLPRPRVERPGGDDDVVVALVAATGVVRFAAARWWTSTEAVLDLTASPSAS